MTDSDRTEPSPGLPRQLQETGRHMQALEGLSERFGQSLARAFARNAAEGRRLDDVLKSMRRSLLDVALKAAAAPLQQALGQGLQSLLGGLFGGGVGTSGAVGGLSLPTPFARGGVISRGMVTPFAQGGVVGAPSYFPLGRGLGLMGERGPEAILPLARGADGRLGVQAGAARPVQVSVTINTPDAEGFRRSEAQVSAALARAVSRGSRAL